MTIQPPPIAKLPSVAASPVVPLDLATKSDFAARQIEREREIRDRDRDIRDQRERDLRERERDLREREREVRAQRDQRDEMCQMPSRQEPTPIPTVDAYGSPIPQGPAVDNVVTTRVGPEGRKFWEQDAKIVLRETATSPSEVCASHPYAFGGVEYCGLRPF